MQIQVCAQVASVGAPVELVVDGALGAEKGGVAGLAALDGVQTEMAGV